MSEMSFFESTTDAIPAAFSARNLVKVSVDFSIKETAGKALDDIANRAKEKGYDGVIGLRIEPMINAGGQFFYLAYGTRVKYES
jgi:uncharacterized protein YbjQ (UPF0145 family)